MLPRPIALLLAAAVALTATGGAAAEKDDDDREDRRDGDKERRGADPKGGPPPHKKPPVGSFKVRPASSQVEGKFVSFSYNATEVRGFAVGGKPVFDARIEESDADDRPARTAGVRARGSELHLEGPAFRLRANDNPNAVARFETDGLVRFEFGPGYKLTPQARGVRVEGSGLVAVVFAQNAPLRVDGRFVVAEDEATFMIDAPKGRFDKHRESLGTAIAKKTVGAEVTVSRGADDVEEDVVTFGNVTVKTVSRPGNVTLYVKGHGNEGRVLVLNLDRALFEGTGSDALVVSLNNVSLASASGLGDVLDADDDGLAPEHWLVEDADGLQVIVSVPHYSVHTLSVASFIREAPPSVVVGILAGLLLVATGGFVLFRRSA